MKIWEDERQCYIRAAMEKNSEAENEALKAQLDAIDWSVFEQIERKETVNELGQRLSHGRLASFLITFA